MSLSLLSHAPRSDSPYYGSSGSLHTCYICSLYICTVSLRRKVSVPQRNSNPPMGWGGGPTSLLFLLEPKECIWQTFSPRCDHDAMCLGLRPARSVNARGASTVKLKAELGRMQSFVRQVVRHHHVDSATTSSRIEKSSKSIS